MDARLIFAVAILLSLLCPLCFAVKEVEDASAHNLGMAPTLLSLQNSCGFPVRASTQDNVFTSAGIAVASIVPQVDNTTSDRANPQLLWSIAAQYPQSYTFTIPSGTSCDPTTLSISSPSALQFNSGELQYQYGSDAQTVPLSLTGPNPVPLNLDSSKLQPADYQGLDANLSVKVSGTLEVDYSFSKTEYQEVQSPVYGSNGQITGYTVSCVPQTTSGTLPFSQSLQDSRIFHVETGPDADFWLNPPLDTRLVGYENAKLLLFARRMPADISAFVNGNRISDGTPFQYSVQIGKCGEQEVASSFAPSGKNMQLNVSNATLFPYQLVDLNYSYLPFYANFSWNETAGGKVVLVSAEDMFGATDNFSRNFSVRSPDAYSSNSTGSALNMRQGSDTQSPAAYPAPPVQAPNQSFSSLAVIFLFPVALGGIGLILWLEKFHL